MREIFIPATKKQFGESVDQKIIYLSNSLSGYKQILDKLVFNPLLKNINIYDNGLSINITDYLDMPLHFWQIVLKELFHKLGKSMPSIKAITQFRDRLNSLKLGKVCLKKHIDATILKDGSKILLDICMI